MKPSLFDVIAIAGFALFLYGVERFSVSVAIMFGGVALFYFGFVMSTRNQ